MSIVANFRFPGHEIWVTLILFFCLLLLAWVRVTNPQKIPSLASGLLRGNAIEEKTITPDSVALFIIFICCTTLLVRQALQYNGIKTGLTNGEEFLLLSLALVAYYLLKTVVLLLCGSIFQVQPDARDYINEIFASACLAAVCFLPVAITLNFIDNINKILFEEGILVMISLFLLYRTIKMFILMMNRGLRMVYLFLYLCTLEIIPLVLLFEYRKSISL